MKVKQPLDLSIRIPEWVTPGEVRGRVDGEERRLDWEGRYAVLGSVKPGQVATLSFPIFERNEVVYIEKQRYRLVLRGNEVVSISPRGMCCPLYQRQHYREDKPRWRQATRFVSNERIAW